MNVTEAMIDAAMDALPFNDILYGDLNKPLNREEMKKALEAALEKVEQE